MNFENKKCIIFDVDGVITDSGSSKELIIENILREHKLFNLPGVENIFGKGFNRIKLLDLIYEIQAFDKKRVLNDINESLAIQESQTTIIPDTLEFIEKNHEKYLFFTNTSLPRSSLLKIFESHNLAKYFMELLSYDSGSKRENIEYVMQVYNIKPHDLLFIDDKMSHIEAVKNTGVQTLLFTQDGIRLEEKVKNIF